MKVDSYRIPVIDPRDYQMDFWRALDYGARYAVISWPRRHGKDVTCFSYMVRQAMQEVGTYYYCFPTLEDGKEILWDSITTIDDKSGPMVDLLCPSFIVKRKNNSDHFIELINGSVIRMKGTDSGKVVGNDGKGFVFSEWQNQKPEMFDYIRPIVRQNNGWAVFNGTMRGKENHLYKDIIRNEGVEGWFSQWLRPEDTKQYYWITPDDYPEDERICVNPELEGVINPATGRVYDNIQWEVDSGASLARTKQEFLNEAVATVEDSYYDRSMLVARKEGRISDFKVNKAVPTWTFWDLGGASNNSDKTCIIFAQKKRIGDVDYWVLVDYYSATGHQIQHYKDVLKTRSYRYAGHYAPHDVSKKFLFGDLISKAAELGIQFERVPKTNNVLADIEVCRQNFKRVMIQSELCAELIPDLDNYHEGASGKPCHNKGCKVCHDASHGADSFRTMIMAEHLGIVRDYLKGEDEAEFDLPEAVGEAETYADAGWEW